MPTYARRTGSPAPPATTPVIPIRVLIADDESSFVRGLGVVLSIGGTHRGRRRGRERREAIARAVETIPDVVLLDVRMAGINGIEAARVIRQKVPATKIIMLTASDEEDDLFEALKAGATGYLRKDTSIEEVAAVVQGVARGRSLITPSMACKLLVELQHADPAESTSYTARELEVLTLLAKGSSSAQIGRDLAITEAMAQAHVGNIVEKLHRGRPAAR